MVNHKGIINYIHSNNFISNPIKISYINNNFNIPIKNNLLDINEEDLLLMLNEYKSKFNATYVSINLLLITNFTNTHILYIDKLYADINKPIMKTLLYNSSTFKPQLEALITMKNLLGEKRYGES